MQSIPTIHSGVVNSGLSAASGAISFQDLRSAEVNHATRNSYNPYQYS